MATNKNSGDMIDAVDRQSEKDLVELIDTSRMESHLDALEDLPRFSGTEAEWEASEYVVETMRSYGLEAEILEYEAYISRPVSASVEITTPTQRTLEEAITTAFSAATPPGGVHGEVVYTEEITNGELPDLSGKVLMTSGLPRPEMVTAAESANAEALIVESPTEGVLHEMIVTPIWGTPSIDNHHNIPDLPIAEITQEDAKWLKECIAAGPTEAAVNSEVTTELTTLPNPVGRLDGLASDRYMVVGNHVDSWYEGLTDNATAMAATLEMARLFSENRPRRGLVFGFWSAHSFGRFAGSAWYADEQWLDLRENGVAYLHLDLNGLKGADRLWYQHMAELEDEQLATLDAISDLPVDPDTDEIEDVPMWEGSNRPGRAADQSFWGVGLSSLFCGIRLPAGTPEGGPVGGGWWWHTDQDTRDKVDLDVLEQETEIYVALASRICNSPILPHDYTATVDDIRSVLDDIEENTDGQISFDDERAELDTLHREIETANGLIDAKAADDASIATAAEDLQVSLGNLLIPALYLERQDYEQEPARSHQLLPGLRVAEEMEELSEREQRFTMTKIKRNRNRLSHRLRKAIERVEAFRQAHSTTPSVDQ